MQQARRAFLDRIGAGFMIIAVAVAILIAWSIDEAWMFFPILAIEVGGFHTVQGLMSWTEQARVGVGRSSYFMFWGPTLVILGVMWILSAKTDVSAVLLTVVFLVWVGAIAMILSLRRKGPAPRA